MVKGGDCTWGDGGEGMCCLCNALCMKDRKAFYNSVNSIDSNSNILLVHSQVK